MKVFCDFHHQALYHSLHLLLEKRFGWELYRAIGPEWYHEGYWAVYPHPATADQFLGVHQGTDVPHDVHGVPLPEIERKNLHYQVEDGIYYVRDIGFETIHRAVRLEKFKEMKFDIIISSIPQHIPIYNRLIAEHQPKAKHVFQVGNAWTSLPGVENVLCSTAPFDTTQNIVFYHQEFDLDVYNYEPPSVHNVVNSYVHYMKRPNLMGPVAAGLPGWTFNRYGAGMNSHLDGHKKMAAAMKNSAFTWHYKPEGDGYGHSIHSSYACGRPALIWKSHYRGKLADALFQDGVTCIDMESKNVTDQIKALQHFSQPEEHTKMCDAAYNKFKEVVNFDEEAARIKTFMESLK